MTDHDLAYDTACAEIDQLLGKIESLTEALSPDSVEEYIKSLCWTKEASDYEKTLVAGNIRAFAATILGRYKDGTL